MRGGDKGAYQWLQEWEQVISTEYMTCFNLLLIIEIVSDSFAITSNIKFNILTHSSCLFLISSQEKFPEIELLCQSVHTFLRILLLYKRPFRNVYKFVLLPALCEGWRFPDTLDLIILKIFTNFVAKVIFLLISFAFLLLMKLSMFTNIYWLFGSL